MARRGKLHFVRSTQVRPTDVLWADGEPLWRDCEKTFRRIDELCGDGASELFAEPTVKEQDGGDRLAVAWFGSEDDEPKNLDAVDRGMRSRVKTDLAARLEVLRPAVASRELGEKVSAMLNLADATSIV